MAGNIHVVMGSDEGMVSEQALKLFNKLKPSDDGGGDGDFSNDIIDGNADNAEGAAKISGDVCQGLQTMSFFGGKKVVWLKNANFLGSDRTGEAARSKEGVEAILQVLDAGLPEDITFLLSASSIDGRRGFMKFLKSNANIELHNKTDVTKDGWQDEVAQIVMKKANAVNLEFEDDALDLFVMLAGEDTRQISSEIEKIDLYLGTDRRTVTEGDIRLIVPLSRAGVVFEIGRALQKRDGARALELIDQQLAKGESPIGIIRASIIPTVRNLYMSATVMERFKVNAHNYRSFESALNALPTQDIAWLPQKKAGGVNVYPLFLAAKDASKFSATALRKALEATHDADRNLVSTGHDTRMVLHKLIAEIVGSPRKNTTQNRRRAS